MKDGPMNINFKDYNLDDFVIRSVNIAGDECYQIFPKHIGVTWDKKNLIFRSSIWTRDGELISAGFKKFFNWNEKPNLTYTPFSLTVNGGCQVMEKIDGCCDGDTVLLTDTDGEMTIKEICETKYNGRVLAYDHDKDSLTYTQIEAHNILPNNKEWFELELENGRTIKLTGNHMVYLPELNCYRRVDELTEGCDFKVIH